MANLLLATVNFEPWMLSVNLTLNFQTLYAKALLFYAKKFEELCSAFFFLQKNITMIDFKRTRGLEESLTNNFVKLTML